ncbi:MAG TPA: peptidase S10 [Hyphomicrobiales bacterium]|nr:peptidase S10 [Hyphomicrobiales bacterium]
MRRFATILAAAIGAVALAAGGGAFAQERHGLPRHDGPSVPAEHRPGPAPAAEAPSAIPSVSRAETLNLPSGPLDYTVTATKIPIQARDSGQELAEIFFVSYTAGKKPDPARPVTFLFNGGPGAASAYLHLGAVGPLRLAFGRQGDGPSEPVALQPNMETWLSFTDLVFVDPVGTGFTTAEGSRDEIAQRFWNSEGDVGTLGAFVVRWLDRYRRRTSPVFLAGESYGGFRIAKLARALQTERGVGVRGLVMVSPALDMSLVPSSSNSPIAEAALLPSYAAASEETDPRPNPPSRASVEDYAFGAYLADLLRGPGDKAAVARMVQHVVDLTGLDKDTVERSKGQLQPGVFLRALHQKAERVGSPYDATVTALPLDAAEPYGRAAEPELEGSLAPLTSAITHYLVDTLGYPADPRHPYEVLSRDVSRQWKWGGHAEAPEAVSDLRAVLALDPKTRALIGNGASDLVTPYAATKLMVNAIEPLGDDPGRLERKVYAGGHMFYTRDDSRAAFAADVRQLYETALGEGAGPSR